MSTYRWTKAIKEDQAFSFVTHTFALTGEEDYLMFKPSIRVLSTKSIFNIPIFWAVSGSLIFSDSLIFSGSFPQSDIFRQFSAVWYFRTRERKSQFFWESPKLVIFCNSGNCGYNYQSNFYWWIWVFILCLVHLEVNKGYKRRSSLLIYYTHFCSHKRRRLSYVQTLK